MSIKRRFNVGGTTQRIKVLEAAQSLHRDGMASFTVAQLAVRCWRRHNDVFGLEGFEHAHPNNKKVESIVFGMRGLIAIGHLSHSDKTNDLQLTNAGSNEIAEARKKLAMREDLPPWVLPFIQRIEGHWFWRAWRDGDRATSGYLEFWSDVAGGRAQFRGMLLRMKELAPFQVGSHEVGMSYIAELEAMDESCGELMLANGSFCKIGD